MLCLTMFGKFCLPFKPFRALLLMVKLHNLAQSSFWCMVVIVGKNQEREILNLSALSIFTSNYLKNLYTL